ncbi:MAG: 50S ribosomal protein L23 [Dehalococcoidia bacterium]|nr:50S ribosomal protein L23 [Chloroflexota bacterium]MXW25698.1 50S ribosomal protein L23 [Dehalococcoidia bacterium]MXZ88235.1 50S ribosomal protein L23 [Dehalococcoidia bacterium]MYA52792.1 50S ribosomal protein L23 [Dehalococcoidia bacterium]MYI86887.1 50S ribosomal protein L23 [Dehalococcoidia bacterium]
MPRELHPYAILLRPLITEKSTSLAGQDKYVFEVDLRANKPQIREAVELAFNVTVLNVNTMVVKGKNRRFGRNVTKQPDWKKAIVTLQSGDAIELFEGI